MRQSTPLPHFTAAIASCLLVVAACGGAAAGTEDAGVKVVATTTILGDIARNIVGDDADVEVLLPIGVDPHDYLVSSRQVAAIEKADLVIANGASLEEGLLDVLDAAGADGANVVELAPLLQPIPFQDGGSEDPHFWLDPVRLVDAASVIASQLSTIDSTVDWVARGETYSGELMAAHNEIMSLLEDLPTHRRQLVTNHDALGYFAERYNFRIVGAVTPGGSTLADPSSADLAALVEVIKKEDVAAIFADTTDLAGLAEAVAAEVGDHVAVVELYTGSLGDAESGADTVIGLLLTNARRIAEALK